MTVGGWLIMKEDHCHTHIHDAVTHNHAHLHDDKHHTHHYDVHTHEKDAAIVTSIRRISIIVILTAE